MDDPRERYRRDPLFARAVDMFQAIIHDVALTPSELREALMLAMYIVEARNPGPWTMRLDEFGRILEMERRRAGTTETPP